MTAQQQIKDLTRIRKSLQTSKSSDMKNSEAFLDFLTIQSEVTKELEKTWQVVKQQMDLYGITKIDGDWGHILLAERKNWLITGSLAPRFYRRVADTGKLAAYYKLHDKPPTGTTLSTTKYLTKKIK